MSLAEFWLAAARVVGLLAANPWRWLATLLVFLVCVESLMFIPYVGFVIKLAIAGIMSGPLVALFAAAAQGQRPAVRGLFRGFAWPAAAQGALALSALIPFVAGIGYLYAQAGAEPLRFFFGFVTKTPPPGPELFVPFKYVMQVAALPFVLVPGAVALGGLAGPAAIRAALRAAAGCWLPLVLLGLLGIGFEWLSAHLGAFLPKPAAAATGGVLLVLFLGWSFGMVYAISAKAFGAASAKVAG